MLQALNDFDFSLCIISGELSKDILFSDEISTNGLSNLKQLIRRLEKPEVVFKKKNYRLCLKRLSSAVRDRRRSYCPAVEEEVADIPVEFIFFSEKQRKIKLESISSMAKSSIRLTRSMRSRQNRLFRCYVTQ